MTFIRYILIQLIAYVVDIGIFLLAFKSGLFGPIISNVFGKVAAGLFAFVTHRNYTFYSNDSADSLNQAFRYFILLTLNVPLSSGILAIFLVFIEEAIISKVLADVVSVTLTFWLSKTFVFVKKQNLVNTTVDSKET